MNTLKILIYTFLIILLFACSTKSEYTINGVFTGENEHTYEGKTVYLVDSDDKNAKKLDSCLVANNSFSFTEEIKDINKLGYISYRLNNVPVMFIKEVGDIKLEIGDDGRRIGGTPQNDSYQQFSDSLYDMIIDSRKFIVELKELEKTDNLSTEKFKEKDLEMDVYIDMLENYTLDYIKQQNTNPLAYYVFYNDAYFVRPIKQRTIMTKLFEGKETEEIKKKKQLLEGSESTAIGQQYKDIRGVNVKGDNLALSELVGKNKITLVDFWASWCGPCRASTPNLQELHKKYKSKGLGVIGITLDDNKKAWLAATEEDKVIWEQIATFKPNDIYTQYGIAAIPYLILIDEQGTIRATGHFDKLILEMKIRSLLE